MLLMKYDENHDGVLDTAEIQNIRCDVSPNV